MNSWRRENLRKQARETVLPGGALEHQDVLALLNSYGAKIQSVTTIDGAGCTSAGAQWADFFGMCKKLIDSHVMPDTCYYASFGKSNMYEMKPWIQGEWGRDPSVELHHQQTAPITPKPPAKLVLGNTRCRRAPPMPDCSSFAQMLSIGKSTKTAGGGESD